MQIKVNVVAWLTAGLLVSLAGSPSPGEPVLSRTRASPAAGMQRRHFPEPTAPHCAADVIPQHAVTFNHLKAPDQGLTTEDVRKAIADAFESPNPMSHRVVWIDPANEDQCFVRVQTLDGGRLPVGRLLDLKVIARMPITRVCPLRNLITLTRGEPVATRGRGRGMRGGTHGS